MYVSHRLLRTQFLPLFVQRRWRKVGITFGRLMRFSRRVSRKRKIPPMQHSDGFCRVKQRQNESGVLRGGWSFRDNPRRGSVQNEHDHILWMVSNQSTKSVGFVTENIMVCRVRQDGFAKFIAVKRQKCVLYGGFYFNPYENTTLSWQMSKKVVIFFQKLAAVGRLFKGRKVSQN